MKKHISIIVWTCSAFKEKKKWLSYVPFGCFTVEDITLHFIHLEFLTESSTEHHLVNLCYVGGMK